MLVNRNKKTRPLLAVALAASLLTGTACAGPSTSNAGTPGKVADGDWTAVVEAAKQEGSFTYYTNAAPEQNQPVIKAFNEKYPEIAVNMVRGAAELDAKLDAEIAGNTDGADLVLITHRQWFESNAANFVPVKDKLPSLANWPADAWSIDQVAPSASISPNGIIAWNTKVFPDGFKNWNDLLAPEVKGKVGLRDTVNTDVASYLQFQEDTNGPEFLPALAKQQPRFYTSMVPMAQSMAAGEIGVAAMSTPPTLVELKKQGAPIDWIIPDETHSLSFTMAMLKKTTRPNAASVFMDFVYSPEGQKALNGDQYGVSPLPGVPDTIDMTGKKSTLLDPKKMTPERTKEWAQKFKEIFGR